MIVERGIFFSSVLAVVALGLSGCATIDCDPSQGGYLRGIGCSAGGAYEQRQQEKLVVLSEERARQAQLDSDYRRAVAEQKTVRAQRGSAERQYAAFRSDLDKMSLRLSRSKTRKSGLEREIADLKAQAKMLEKDTFTPESEKAERLDRLMRQKAALEREIDMALKR